MIIMERIDKSIKTILSSDWRFNLLENWHEIVGPLNTHTRIERIEKDSLIIGVYDAHWMQELYILSKDLLKKINNILGENKIKRISFKLVQKRSNLKFNLNKKQFTQNNLQNSLTENENKALSKISDPQLQEAMKSFLLKRNFEKHF